MYKIFSFVLVGFFMALLFSFDTFAQDEIKITPGDGAANDFFGDYVSIFGDYAIVSAPLDDDQILRRKKNV